MGADNTFGETYFKPSPPTKVCRIINGTFSWILEVDGQTIPFQGGYNADYFRELYSKLGYTIEETDETP